MTSVFANPVDDLWLHRLSYGPVRHYGHSLWDHVDEINEGLEPGDPNFLDLSDGLGPRRPPATLEGIFCGDSATATTAGVAAGVAAPSLLNTPGALEVLEC